MNRLILPPGWSSWADRSPKWPRLTLQRVFMIVCVACIWAAQASIELRYQRTLIVELPDVVWQNGAVPPPLPEIKTNPIETRTLSAVNFIIVCAAIAFRKYGKKTAWTAIAAARVATAIAAAVAAFRYSN
jgi:hypothetical protein